MSNLKLLLLVLGTIYFLSAYRFLISLVLILTQILLVLTVHKIWLIPIKGLLKLQPNIHLLTSHLHVW